MDSWEDYISKNLARRLEEKKSICWNTNTRESLRIRKGEYTSFQVPGFMTRITYPANDHRDYSVVVYIHYIEYLINRTIKEEGLDIKDFSDYEAVYNRIISRDIGTESSRFYKNYLRRRNNDVWR